jgi:preprotein translocase subunit SecE
MTETPKQPEEDARKAVDEDNIADSGSSVPNLLQVGAGVSVDSSGHETGKAVPAQPAQMGAARYVHAAFCAGATLIGFLAARLFVSIWNWLVEWPLAVQHVPQLLRLSEEERSGIGSIVGVALGACTIVFLYRKPDMRVWAEEVSGELAKVTWPDRQAVTNGTLIVIIASLLATVYVTLLDRLWSFATRLIYGA